MGHNLPGWCNAILKLKESTALNKNPPYLDLNELAFERLKQCRTNKAGTIEFDTIRSKLCPNFSIDKKRCMHLLNYLEMLGKIEFVKQTGVKILGG